MADTAVIKLHPGPEEYIEAETAFLRAVGLCITQWAYIDRQLFRLFKFGLGAEDVRAAIVYYEKNSIGRRLDHVDSLLKNILKNDASKSFISRWQMLRTHIRKLLPTRNIIAHQPVRRLGTSDGEKAIYIYGIHIEPYERLLNKTYDGLGGKDVIETDDLIDHSEQVMKLEEELRVFARDAIATFSC